MWRYLLALIAINGHSKHKRENCELIARLWVRPQIGAMA